MEPELTGLGTHLTQREKAVQKQVCSCRSQAGLSSLPWFYPSTSNCQLGRILERSLASDGDWAGKTNRFLPQLSAGDCGSKRTWTGKEKHGLPECNWWTWLLHLGNQFERTLCCCWRGSPVRCRSARLHLGRVRSCFSHSAPSTSSCLQGLPPARQSFCLLRSPQRATQSSKLCLVKRCPVFLSHFSNIPVV